MKKTGIIVGVTGLVVLTGFGIFLGREYSFIPSTIKEECKETILRIERVYQLVPKESIKDLLAIISRITEICNKAEEIEKLNFIGKAKQSQELLEIKNELDECNTKITNLLDKYNIEEDLGLDS